MATPESPPRPDPLRLVAQLQRAAPQDQRHLLEAHREQILARTTYLDGVVAAFRFDHPLDADPPDAVRVGIERRLQRLRELAASVRDYAAAQRWSEAWTYYEDAERVAVNLDLWIKTARATTAAHKFRQGRRALPAPWHELVRQWHAEGLSFPKIWARSIRHVRQDGSIIAAVVESDKDPACHRDEALHPRGPHWHCYDRHGQIRPVAAGTIKNFLTHLPRP